LGGSPERFVTAVLLEVTSRGIGRKKGDRELLATGKDRRFRETQASGPTIREFINLAREPCGCVAGEVIEASRLSKGRSGNFFRTSGERVERRREEVAGISLWAHIGKGGKIKTKNQKIKPRDIVLSDRSKDSHQIDFQSEGRKQCNFRIRNEDFTANLLEPALLPACRGLTPLSRSRRERGHLNG